jgi:hypothetical protein
VNQSAHPWRRETDRDTNELELVGVPPVHHLRAHFFEAAFAVATVISGILFFASPAFVQRTTIGRDVPYIADVWYALYIVGGLQILIGLWFDNRPVFGRFGVGRRIEVLGVFLTGTAALVEAVTVYGHVGVSRAALMATALCLGCFHRAVALLARPRLHVVIPIGHAMRRPPPEEP